MKNRIKIIYIIALLIIIVLSIACIRQNIKRESKNFNQNDEWISVCDIDISNVSKDNIGYLSIPCLNNEYYINMPIKEGIDLDILATAIRTFSKNTFKKWKYMFSST